MSDWATGENINTAPEVTEGADAPEVEATTAESSALSAQLSALQNQMHAMQQAHQSQLQTIYGAMANGQQVQQPVENEPVVPNIPGLDEDDPYYDQFSSVMKTQVGRNNELQGQVAELQAQLSNMTVSLNQKNVQSQVEAALEKHRVPQSLADDVRTVAYAYMASAPKGQHVSAESMVAQFMQNLGHYATEARKEWSEEAKRPKPISIAANMAGIPDEEPSNMEEAKARSLAIMKAMVGG